MKRQFVNWLATATLAVLSLVGVVQAQPADAKVETATGADVEVLTRGPLHEAFAIQFQTNAVAGVSVDRQPPELIEEIPPAVRPAGDDVLWIPGYWAWDAEATDFLWVSGTWRHAPPGHRWIPGYWNRADAGFQWMSGFWMPDDVAQLPYYSAPPNSLERGPNSTAPGDNYFWVPGSQVPRNDRYVWQPGYWCPYQRDHIWVPSYHARTAAGYVHVPGYWDYRLDQRGTIFAPIRAQHAANATARIRYTPQVVIPVSTLQFHLFSQANSNAYVFGDYYDQRYANNGYRPWYTTQFVKGMPDPLFGYYNWMYSRQGPNYYRDVLGKWTAYYTKNVDLRPALTLTRQLELADQHRTAANLTNSLLAVPLTDVVAQTPTAFVNLTAQQTTGIVASTTGLQALSLNRTKVEGQGAGALNLAGAANSSAKLNSRPLSLPAVTSLRAPNVAVPAHPSQIIRQLPATAPNVGGGNVVPQVPPVKLPGLPL